MQFFSLKKKKTMNLQTFFLEEINSGKNQHEMGTSVILCVTVYSLIFLLQCIKLYELTGAPSEKMLPHCGWG